MKYSPSQHPSQTSKQGFSLVELIVYIALASVMFGVMASFAGSLVQSRNRHTAISQVESQGAHVIESMTQYVRNAESIQTPAVGAQGSYLNIDMYPGAQSPVELAIIDGVLIFVEGGGSVVALTNDQVVASSLFVENLSHPDTRGVVRISFTLTYNNTVTRSEQNYEQTFYTSATLR